MTIAKLSESGTTLKMIGRCRDTLLRTPEVFYCNCKRRIELSCGYKLIAANAVTTERNITSTNLTQPVAISDELLPYVLESRGPMKMYIEAVPPPIKVLL